MTLRTRMEVFKWMVYVSIAFLLLSLQSSPDLLTLFSVRPNFLLSYAVFLSIFEECYKGGVFASFLGLMMDFSNHSEVGFYGILFLFISIIVSILFKKYLQVKYSNALLCFLVSMAVIEGFGFLFFYLIWYQNATEVFDLFWLKQNLYTIAVTPFVYGGVKWLNTVLNEKRD